MPGCVTFAGWMSRVDLVLDALAGLSTRDVEYEGGVDFRDLYEGGASPEGAARLALQEAGYDVP